METDVKMIIIKSNKKCITALPKIAEYQELIIKHNLKFVNTEKKRSYNKSYGTYPYLVYGFNYMPLEYWEKAKTHKMVKLLIDEGLLEEIIDSENEKDLVIVEKKIIDVKSRIDEIDIITIGKVDEDIKVLQKKLDNTKDEKQKEKLEKDLIKLGGKKEAHFEDKEKLTKEMQEAKEKLEKYQIGEKKYKTLSIKKRKKILEETFDLRTLYYFLDEEHDPAVRLNIQKKIDATVEGHVQTEKPKSHLETTK